MFYNKAQKEVFNAMLSEKRTFKFPIENSKFFITVNGHVGYVFPQDILQINIEKVRDMPALNLDGIIATENKLEATKDFVLISERTKTMIRRYKKGRQSVFVNPKLLEYFQNPTLYQKDAPLGIIVVTERNSRSDDDSIVGVVLPIKDNEGLAEHYADYF
jgi:hypothetical protein